MGYTTEFTGQITIDPPLRQSEIEFLTKFAGTRRMNRTKGPYFVDGTGDFGQGHDPDIINYNCPPVGQRSLWCGWVPTEDGTAIEWDGSEKFYESVRWMQYIIDHFLSSMALAVSVPENIYDSTFSTFTFDHVLNGTIEAQGEDSDDRWKLVVKDNVVTQVKVGEEVTEGKQARIRQVILDHLQLPGLPSALTEEIASDLAEALKEYVS